VAKFIFQLQGVLRHRELLEQERQRELAVVAAEHAAIMGELRALDEVVGKAVADLRQNHLVGTIDLSFLAAHRRFVLATQRKGMVAMARLQEVQKRLDIARGNLAEAAKQKKIIEKLREKQHAIWTEALAKKEMSALDEVAMQMAAGANAE
jgi:flagellar FliJ protein